MDMDVQYNNEAIIWKEADKREQIEEQIEEQQKEDIQSFNKTMKTFDIDQDEVNRFKSSLGTSGAVSKRPGFHVSAIFGYADKFLHVLLMFRNKPGSEKWCHTLDQLRKWETLPAKLVTELADSVKNDKEWKSFERQNKIRE